MTWRRWSCVVGGAALAALLAPSTVLGADPPEAKRQADFDVVDLKGLSLGFGMLRLDNDDRAQGQRQQRLQQQAAQEPLPLTGHVVEHRNALVRLIVDEASGAAFGYRVEAESLSTTVAALRVDIRPLAPSDEKDLKRLAVCRTCPAPRLVGSGPTRFPPTQIVKSGDTMVIDLLVRPDTGEKVVDVLKFSNEKVTRAVLDGLRTRLGGASRHATRAGDLLARGSEEAALLEYEKAVQLNPADAEAWHTLSVLRHRRGSYGKAIAGYRQALKIRPDLVLARRNLATAHLDRAEAVQAFEEYRRAYRAAPAALESKDDACVKAQDVAMQRYMFAKVYAGAGKTEAALEALKSALDAGFTDVERIHEDPEFKPLLRDPRLAALGRL
jgi:tetratricopeptide (TPR) repeat protein